MSKRYRRKELFLKEDGLCLEECPADEFKYYLLVKESLIRLSERTLAYSDGVLNFSLLKLRDEHKVPSSRSGYYSRS